LEQKVEPEQSIFEKEVVADEYSTNVEADWSTVFVQVVAAEQSTSNSTTYPIVFTQELLWQFRKGYREYELLPTSTTVVDVIEFWHEVAVLQSM